MNPPHLVEKSKKKKTREEKGKKKVQKGEGLCSTCNNEPSCTYNEAGGPVMQCEEFDGYKTAPGKVEHISKPKKGNGNGKENAQYKGLCVNCDHRAACANANLEGGVWYCEEYE